MIRLTVPLANLKTVVDEAISRGLTVESSVIVAEADEVYLTLAGESLSDMNLPLLVTSLKDLSIK